MAPGAVVIDPHEYANVLGLDGIRYVLESSKNLPLDFFIMLPSCVPATALKPPARASRPTIWADDRRRARRGHRRIDELSWSLSGGEKRAGENRRGQGQSGDGHAPGLRGKNLNAYALAGVRSDHESTELDEAREKLRLGLHILLREGSTERNLVDLLPLINPHNASIAPLPPTTSSRATSSRKATLTMPCANPSGTAFRRSPRCKSPASTPRGIIACITSAPLRRVFGRTLLFLTI